jgi:hypothetical protein
LEPASLQIVAGNQQTDTVASTLDPIVVRILDAEQKAVLGQIVNFVVIQGGGSVFAGSAITNDEGQAQEIWTLGTTAGEQALEARAVDATTGEALVFGSIRAMAIPDVAVTLEIEPDTLAGFVNIRIPLEELSVTATDEYGNAIGRSRAEFSVTGLEADATHVWATTQREGELVVSVDQLTQAIPVFVFEDFTALGDEWEWRSITARDPPFLMRPGVYVDSSLTMFRSDSLTVLGFYQHSMYGPAMEYDVWWAARSRWFYLTTGEVEFEDWGPGNPAHQNIALTIDDGLRDPGNNLLPLVSTDPRRYFLEITTATQRYTASWTQLP